MGGSVKINNLKNVTKAVLLLLVISLQGGFVEDSIGNAVVRPDFKPTISKKFNYIPGATLERISFQSQRSEGLPGTIARNGVLKIQKDAPATLLVCHGYMCDKDDVSFMRSIFTSYNVMTFDFRAHGEDAAGQYCTFGKEELFDVIAAVNYLKSRSEVAGKPLIVYGFSMGAVSAIEAQARAGDLFDAMILDCPFDSSDSVIRRGLANLKFNIFGFEVPLPRRDLLEKYAYSPIVQSMLKAVLKTIAKFDATQTHTRIMKTSPADSAEKIKVPCYFIACKNDEKISVDSVTAVYAGTQGYKRLWITNGRRHFDSFFYNPEKYMHKINKFVKKVITNTLDVNKQAKIIEDPPIA